MIVHVFGHTVLSVLSWCIAGLKLVLHRSCSFRFQMSCLGVVSVAFFAFIIVKLQQTDEMWF